MRVQNITALFHKQTKDILKNLPVLVLFIVYPIVSLVMTQAIKDQAADTSTMFISIFATMHCVFTPFVAVSSIIAEEKEKNTLRVLIMSNVTLREYLFSIGGFVLAATLLTGSIFIFISNKSVDNVFIFLLSMSIGSLISIILGICVGIFAKNAAAANGLSVPIGMFFAFLPMLSNYNKGIEAVSKFTFGQHISYLIAGKEITLFGIAILCINFAVLLVISAVLFKKSISEE